MRVNAAPIRVTLRWGMPLTVRDGQGACITARRGTVWITQDHDRRDVVLTSGESFRLERAETAIVQAMDAAEVLILPPADLSTHDSARQGTARTMVRRILDLFRREPGRLAQHAAERRVPVLGRTIAGR